jgi:hypothetical protein
MALIFHDAFLTNAYISNKSIRLDSLSIYEPIFANYGYTTEDVYYTLGNFSKRKSANLGNVVEQAIAMLEEEGKFYNREVMILDTIDNVALRTFMRRVLSDSLIRVKSLRDTAKLRFKIEVQPGEYNLRFSYLIDSLDKNEGGVRATFWLEGRDSSRTSFFNPTLYRLRKDNFTRRFVVDTTMRYLRFNLIEFREKPQSPSLTITDLQVDYTPLKEVVVDSLFLKQLDIRIFSDEFFTANAADSL